MWMACERIPSPCSELIIVLNLYIKKGINSGPYWTIEDQGGAKKNIN